MTDRIDADNERHQQRHGPWRLWDSVAAAHQLWQHRGRPDPDRFGIVANPTTQFVWPENDDGWYRWPLPLV